MSMDTLLILSNGLYKNVLERLGARQNSKLKSSAL